jgi:shikimate kinase
VVTVDKIFLVGFMAAGKTTVARSLAARLGWRAEDVDELIEARERRTVTEIFARNGEPYFRAIEREILRLLLPLRHVVVATGGGTFVDPENRAAMHRDGLSIWLDVPFGEVLARLPADGRRPLAADRTQMERLFAARQIAYAQAHLRVDAAGLPAEAIVERIMDGIAQLERRAL